MFDLIFYRFLHVINLNSEAVHKKVVACTSHFNLLVELLHEKQLIKM